MEVDFDKIKEDLITVGLEVKDKAKETAEIARLKLDIKSKERELNRLFAELGRAYFAAHQEDEEVPEEELFAKIRVADAELTGLKVNLESHKKSGTADSAGEKEDQAVQSDEAEQSGE